MAANTVTHRFKAVSAKELGAIQNHLGILTDDYKRVRPAKLRELSNWENTQKAATTLNVSRPQVFKDEIQVKADTLKRVLDLVRATDLAFELLGKNLSETKKWVMSPNEVLFGATPFEICLSGKAAALLDWLRGKKGLQPGLAF